MQRISRRDFVKQAAVTGATLTSIPGILAACGTSSSTAKTTQLSIAAVKGDEDKALKAIAPDYKNATGVTLNIVEYPYSDLYTKLVTTFQANANSFDLVMMDDPWMPQFGTSGALQPLETTYGITRDSDIPSIVYDVGTWPPPKGPVPPSQQGKPPHLLGVTVVGNVEMFMYRSDKSDAPKTWDDVLANAQKFNDKGKFAGYVIRGKATNPVSSDSLPILWSFGGNIFDDNWKVVLDSDASLTAVKFLTQQLKAYAEDGASNVDAADRSRLMAIGQAYQSTVWPGEVTGTVLDPSITTVSGKVAFIPIPQGPSGKGIGMMGNWLLGIPKGSQNGPAAADFIKWLTQPANMRNYVSKGGIPTRTSILNDASLTAANPYFPALASSLSAGPNWRPRTDQWNAVETIYGTQMNAILAGLVQPEAAMKTAADQIRTTMKNAGYPS